MARPVICPDAPRETIYTTGSPFLGGSTPQNHPHDPKLPDDEYTGDLERDSAGRQASSMEGLVREDAEPLPEPVEEQYLADPEPHRQHSRKGQAESPRKATLNQLEHNKHGA
jgi:hypothetical protein